MMKKLFFLITFLGFSLNVLATENPDQILQQAHSAIEKRDFAREIELLQPLAQQGNSDATYLLGLNYFYGKNVAKDPHKALMLFQQSANQGDSSGMMGLFLYYNSLPTNAKNTALTFRWLQQSANAGNARTQFILGMAYYTGTRFVQKDLKKALIWFTKAADQHQNRAEFMLFVMYLNGEGTAVDQDKSLDMLIQSAKDGNPNAQNLLKQVAQPSVNINYSSSSQPQTQP